MENAPIESIAIEKQRQTAYAVLFVAQAENEPCA